MPRVVGATYGVKHRAEPEPIAAQKIRPSFLLNTDRNREKDADYVESKPIKC